MLVHGKQVNRRASKAGLVNHAATSSPLPSITPLYMLAIAGLQCHTKAESGAWSLLGSNPEELAAVLASTAVNQTRL